MGKVRLSEKERRRIEILRKVQRGLVSLGKGAELLGLGYRQMRRVFGRYQAAGNLGLKHGLRDRASNRQLAPARRERVLELYRRSTVTLARGWRASIWRGTTARR